MKLPVTAVMSMATLSPPVIVPLFSKVTFELNSSELNSSPNSRAALSPEIQDPLFMIDPPAIEPSIVITLPESVLSVPVFTLLTTPVP